MTLPSGNIYYEKSPGPSTDPWGTPQPLAAIKEVANMNRVLPLMAHQVLWVLSKDLMIHGVKSSTDI